MGRKRTKKTCTSCGFNHTQSPEEECEAPVQTAEEITTVADEELGAVGGVPAAVSTEEAVTTTETDAGVENRLNSRIDHLQNMIVDLVSGLKTPGEKKSKDKAKKSSSPKPNRQRCWGLSDSSDSDSSEEDERASSTKKEKKREKKRFLHKNFTNRGESVASFESLMMVMFRTLLEMKEEDEEIDGLLQHGLLLSEKASKDVYRQEAFLSYDEAIRRRAGREGPQAFGEVRQEEVMRHFCFENSNASEGKRSQKGKGKKSEKICLRFNGEDGCNVKNCTYAHKCLACDDSGHGKRDCKNIKKKDK